MRMHKVKPLDSPLDLATLGTDVKVGASHRIKPGTLGPKFWDPEDFVLGRVPVLGQLVSALALPRGRLLCVPLGRVVEVTEWMCPFGTFKCSAVKDK